MVMAIFTNSNQSSNPQMVLLNPVMLEAMLPLAGALIEIRKKYGKNAIGFGLHSKEGIEVKLSTENEDKSVDERLSLG